ncbi:MAG TPA: hypothetical protein VJT13_04325 [Xanthobacteraceae bacterium]|jgi:hypothetical protein|nr:hypothetical protein [Xanthobacteraceae bacterium]
MISRMMIVALAATFALGTTTFPTVSSAEMLKKEETKKEKKEATPKQKKQQQKMKDCAKMWNEEKKTKNVQGKKAHQEFMSGCLKG